jgi:hypothetical protein
LPGDATFVDPKRGRLVAFTSGMENIHHVTKVPPPQPTLSLLCHQVTQGTRRAITIAFTCTPAVTTSHRLLLR